MASLEDFTNDSVLKEKSSEDTLSQSIVSGPGKKRRLWHEKKTDSDQVNVGKNYGINSHEDNTISFDKLRKNPLKLINFFYDQVDIEQERITKKITLMDIVNALDITRDSARTAIKFLLKNSVIERVSFKSGKEGGAIYSISTIVYQDIQESRKMVKVLHKE